MDTMTAFVIGQANQGKTAMVFDWNKAAQLIKKRKPRVASAGLAQDWEYTGGEIYRDGEINEESYTYLASTWATPELDLDGCIEDCYIMEDKTEWNSHTKWPDSAKKILGV